jgi:hypothetical protein
LRLLLWHCELLIEEMKKCLFEQFSILVQSTITPRNTHDQRGKGQKLQEPNLILSRVSTSPCGDPLPCSSHSRTGAAWTKKKKKKKKKKERKSASKCASQRSTTPLPLALLLSAYTPRLVGLEKATGCGGVLQVIRCQDKRVVINRSMSSQK